MKRDIHSHKALDIFWTFLIGESMLRTFYLFLSFINYVVMAFYISKNEINLHFFAVHNSAKVVLFQCHLNAMLIHRNASIYRDHLFMMCLIFFYDTNHTIRPQKLLYTKCYVYLNLDIHNVSLVYFVQKSDS